MALRIQFITNSNRLNVNGFTFDQEIQVYDKQLEDVYDNPRWYLDNLEYLVEYRLRWKNYNHTPATLPYKYVKQDNL